MALGVGGSSREYHTLRTGLTVTGSRIATATATTIALTLTPTITISS